MYRPPVLRVHAVLIAALIGIVILPSAVASVEPVATVTTSSITPDSVGPRGVVTVDVAVSPPPVEVDAFAIVSATQGLAYAASEHVELDAAGEGSIELDTTNWPLGEWTIGAAFPGTASAAASASTPSLLTVTAPMDPPPAVADPSMVDAGHSWTCALDEGGKLSCWGLMPSGLHLIPDGEYIDVDAGGCAVARTGELECWGEERPWVYWHPPGGTFLEVSGSCAIRVDHTLACWAEPWYTDLLDPPYGEFHGLSVGSIACALNADDEIECWGGFQPNGPPSGAFERVTVGSGRACGLRGDGVLECWGFEASAPAGIFTDVSSGEKHTCAIRLDGDVACAGWDGGPPALVEGPFDRLSADGWHLCARHVGADIECWGATAYPYWNVQPAVLSTPPTTAYLGAQYVHQFQASSVVPAPSWSVEAGVLPAGLTLSPGGLLSGVPTTSGTFGPLTIAASNGIAPPAVQTFSLEVGVDATGPTVSNVLAQPLAGSRITNGWLQTRVSWSGTDAESGVARYQLEQRTDGGAFVRLGSFLAGPTMDLWLAPWHTYQMRVRGVDRAGNIGPWMTGASFRVVPHQDVGGGIDYDGTWTTVTSTAYVGGTMRYATDAGASASLTFNGRWFAWVGALGPDRGTARVYVDGTLVATVPLWNASGLPRKVLWSKAWTEAGPHTVSIVVRAKTGATRVDVDALFVGK